MQRRLIYHTVRALLFLLGILLVWKMVWIATTLGDVSNLADGDEKVIKLYFTFLLPNSNQILFCTARL